MSPKLTLPSVPLRCPRFPKSSDFIALDCPQFGNRIGDRCPALPSVAQAIGDRIGDEDPPSGGTGCMQASFHAGFSMIRLSPECQPRKRNSAMGIRQSRGLNVILVRKSRVGLM